MAEPRDVRELVGEDVDDRELDRLRRVHDLLVAAGPPPELSPVLQQAPLLGARPVGEPRFSWFGSRRFGAALALAAALAAVGFGIGYLVGHAPSKSFRSVHTVLMLGTGSAPAARATIEVGSPDSNGNIPMLVRVSGLPTLHGRSYYELFLTKHRRPLLSCGTFNASTTKAVSFRLSIPYALKRYDGWVVTREVTEAPHPGPIVLTTFI